MNSKYPLATQQFHDEHQDSLGRLGIGSAALLVLLAGVYYHFNFFQSDKKESPKKKPVASKPILASAGYSPVGGNGTPRVPNPNCNANQPVEIPHPPAQQRGGKLGDGGVVWVPKEAMCGGTYPLLVSLHGSGIVYHTKFRTPTRHVGKTSRKRLERTVEQMINSGQTRPLIIAGPVYDKRKRSGLWLAKNIDFNAYVTSLKQMLRQRYNIQVESVSFMGHSGAHCYNLNGGLAAAAIATNAYAVLAAEPTCPGAVGPSLDKAAQGRKLFFMSGAPHRDKDEFNYLAGPNPVDDSRNARNRYWYSKMMRNGNKHVYWLKDFNHGDVPRKMLLEAAPRLFPVHRYAMNRGGKR